LDDIPQKILYSLQAETFSIAQPESSSVYAKKQHIPKIRKNFFTMDLLFTYFETIAFYRGFSTLKNS